MNRKVKKVISSIIGFTAAVVCTMAVNTAGVMAAEPVVYDYAGLKEKDVFTNGIDDGTLTISGIVEDNTHGYTVTSKSTVKIHVKGNQTIAFGTCSYGNPMTVKDSEGNVYFNGSTKGSCYNSKNPAGTFITFDYDGGKETDLTFEFNGNSYINYIAITDYVEKDKYSVSGKVVDKNGNTITNAVITASEGTLSAENGEYTISGVTAGKELTITASCKGYSSVVKIITVTEEVKDNVITLGDLKEVNLTEVGASAVYNFKTDSNFTKGVNYYDTFMTLENYSYNGGQHGIAVNSNTVFTVNVPGSVQIALDRCMFPNGKDNDGNDRVVYFSVKDSDGNDYAVNEALDSPTETDGDVLKFDYRGGETTLTFTFGSSGYIHDITFTKTEDAVLPKFELVKTYTVKNDDNATTDIYFVGKIKGTAEELAKINEVGFALTKDGVAAKEDLKTNKVYSSLSSTIAGLESVANDTKAEDGAYYAAFRITGVPNADVESIKAEAFSK